MKNCTIKFEFGTLPDQKFVLSNVQVDENTDTILRKIAEKIIESKDNIEVKEIKARLEDSVSQAQQIETSRYKEGGLYLAPNFTGKALKAAFPNYNWGDDVPDVLLVDDLNIGGTSLSSKVIHMDKAGTLHESYIVPSKNLSQFALLTRIWSNSKKLKSLQAESREEIEQKLSQLEKAAQEDLGMEAEYSSYRNLVAMLDYARNLFGDVSENLNTKDYWEKQIKYMMGRIEQIRGAYESTYSKTFNLEKKVNDILALTETQNNKKKELEKKKAELENLDETKDGERIEQLQKEISKLERSVNFNEVMIQKNVITIQNSFDYLNSNIDAYTILHSVLNDNQEAKQFLPEFEKLSKNKSAVTQYINRMKDLRQKRLKMIKSIEDRIDTDRRITTAAYTQLMERFGIKDSLAIQRKGAGALEQFIDIVINKNDALDLLAPGNYDLQNKINVFLQMLYGRSVTEDFGSSILNAFINHALSHNNTIRLSYIKSYMFQTGNLNVNLASEISDDQAIDFVINNVNRMQNKYYFVNEKNGTFKLNRKRSLISHNIHVDNFEAKAATEFQNMKKFMNGIQTLYNIDPMTDENNHIIRKHGYYLYELTNNSGKKVYYALKDKITSVTPQWLSRGFDNVIDAENYAENKFQQSKLSDGLLFLRKGEISEDSMIPTSNDREWSRGEIAETIQHKLGDAGIEGMTVSQFEYWINNIFGEDRDGASDLLKTLDTLEKRAVFKTFFKRNIVLYESLKQKMFELAKEISNSPTVYYMATQDTVKVGPKPKNYQYDTRSRYTRFRRLVNYASDRAIVKKPNSQNVSLKAKTISDWFVIKNIFSNAGVHMELLTNSQMSEKTGMDGIIGFHQNGIIYINTELATMEKALHEYSHLFLAMIKSTPQGQAIYEDILGQYASVMSIETEGTVGNKRFHEKSSLYQNEIRSAKLNGDQAKLYVLEEMFADDYGKFLQNQVGSLTDIFTQVNEVVSQFAVLSQDKMKTFRLLEDGENQFKLFAKLMNVEKIREQTGFPIDYSKGSEVESVDTDYVSPYEQKMLDFMQGISQTDTGGKSLESFAQDSKEKSSIFKKCD